ncbi:MAG: 2-C-methyl-D-erythritol 4-phosphate cytidylyltransferase [Moorellales bacterium]
MSELAAVVVAAGRGERLGAGRNKAFVDLGGHPLLAYCLAGLEASPEIAAVVVAVGSGEEDACRRLLRPYRLSKVVEVVAGGATRQESVARALRAVDPRYRWVAVHDGARPFVSPELVRELADAARARGAAVPGLALRDTVKRLEGAADRVAETLPRERLVAVQTPQVFSRSLLEEAHRQAEAKGLIATDDAALVESLGHPVWVVPGDYRNLKITTPEDLELAEFYLSRGRVRTFLPSVTGEPGRMLRGNGRCCASAWE